MTKQSDERVRQVSGYSAAIMLGLTQVLLGLIILYRVYVLHQPDREIWDLHALMFFSIAGYFVLRSWLGGFFPVPTFKQAAATYGAMVVVLFVILSVWLGLPDLSEWWTNILPVLLGPAIIVLFYWTAAYVGRRRIDKLSSE